MGDAFCRHASVWGVSAPRSTLPGMAEKTAGSLASSLGVQTTIEIGLVPVREPPSFFFLKACLLGLAGPRVMRGLCRVLGCEGLPGVLYWIGAELLAWSINGSSSLSASWL